MMAQCNKPTLTSGQARVMREILLYAGSFGRWPTVRLLASMLKMSPSGVANHLEDLVHKGYVLRPVKGRTGFRVPGVKMKLDFESSPRGRELQKLAGVVTYEYPDYDME